MSQPHRRRAVVRRSRTAHILANACIEELEQRRLLTGSIPAGYRYLETVTLAGNGLDGTTVHALASGREYYLKATGSGDADTGHEQDAEFRTAGSAHDNTATDGNGTIDAGIKVNSASGASQSPYWGTYDSSHTYITDIFGTGSTLTLAMKRIHVAQWPSYTGDSPYKVDVYTSGPLNAPSSLGDPGGVIGTAAGAEGGQNGTEGVSASGVRYADGATVITSTDLQTFGFGRPWGITRSWTNDAGNVSNSQLGNGWTISQQPYVQQIDSTHFAVVTGSGSTHQFTKSGSDYSPEHFDTATLTLASGVFTFVDTTGTTITFDDFSNATLQKRGQFKKLVDPSGSQVEVTSYFTDTGLEGCIQEILRTDGTNVESYWYGRIDSGDLIGRIANVGLYRSTTGGSSWSLDRSVAYDYYGDNEDNGLLGNLKSATREEFKVTGTNATKLSRIVMLGAEL